MVSIDVYDFDGVLSNGSYVPEKGSFVVITGRCFDEYEEVYQRLKEVLGYVPPVYFNPMRLEDRGNHTRQARAYSANHKARTLKQLIYNGVKVDTFYEDDPFQFKIIKNLVGPIMEYVLVERNENVEL